MLHAESTAAIQLGLSSADGSLSGWERALGEVREGVVPALTVRALAAFEVELVQGGAFRCPRCAANAPFRRRGRRRRRILSAVGALALSVQMVGCDCGHRFAPLLRALGIAPHRRCAPRLERRALELCSELPYRRAAAQLAREAGAAPSARSLGRLVRRAARALRVDEPRAALREIEAVLVDETRVRAGPRKGPDDRGRELKIALALRRRPRADGARLELLGATVAHGWPALGPLVRVARDARIGISDGEWGARAVLEAALPAVPHQVCTFHVRDSLDHRLWQDGMRFGARRPLVAAIADAIEHAPSAADAERTVVVAMAMAERHHWRRTFAHLRELAPYVATWLRVDPSGAIAHTTSLLERTMREVNRRVDPVGVRWSLDGAEAIVAVLLARRFAHPRWRRLCQDRGRTKAWARLS